MRKSILCAVLGVTAIVGAKERYEVPELSLVQQETYRQLENLVVEGVPSRYDLYLAGEPMAKIPVKEGDPVEFIFRFKGDDCFAKEQARAVLVDLVDFIDGEFSRVEQLQSVSPGCSKPIHLWITITNTAAKQSDDWSVLQIEGTTLSYQSEETAAPISETLAEARARLGQESGELVVLAADMGAWREEELGDSAILKRLDLIGAKLSEHLGLTLDNTIIYGSPTSRYRVGYQMTNQGKLSVEKARALILDSIDYMSAEIRKIQGHEKFFPGGVQVDDLYVILGADCPQTSWSEGQAVGAARFMGHELRYLGNNRSLQGDFEELLVESEAEAREQLVSSSSENGLSADERCLASKLSKVGAEVADQCHLVLDCFDIDVKSDSTRQASYLLQKPSRMSVSKARALVLDCIDRLVVSINVVQGIENSFPTGVSAADLKVFVFVSPDRILPQTGEVVGVCFEGETLHYVRMADLSSNAALEDSLVESLAEARTQLAAVS